MCGVEAPTTLAMDFATEGFSAMISLYDMALLCFSCLCLFDFFLPSFNLPLSTSNFLVRYYRHLNGGNDIAGDVRCYLRYAVEGVGLFSYAGFLRTGEIGDVPFLYLDVGDDDRHSFDFLREEDIVVVVLRKSGKRLAEGLAGGLVVGVSDFG